jgi:hypothetical protein
MVPINRSGLSAWLHLRDSGRRVADRSGRVARATLFQDTPLEDLVAGLLIRFRKRSADAYIRAWGRIERRHRERHVLVTGYDLRADVGIRAPIFLDFRGR